LFVLKTIKTIKGMAIEREATAVIKASPNELNRTLK